MQMERKNSETRGATGKELRSWYLSTSGMTALSASCDFCNPPPSFAPNIICAVFVEVSHYDNCHKSSKVESKMNE
jgi:hypothetical protein